MPTTSELIALLREYADDDNYTRKDGTAGTTNRAVAMRQAADALTATTQSAPAAAEQSEEVLEAAEKLIAEARTIRHVYRKGFHPDKAEECFAAAESALREALAAPPPAATGEQHANHSTDEVQTAFDPGVPRVQGGGAQEEAYRETAWSRERASHAALVRGEALTGDAHPPAAPVPAGWREVLRAARLGLAAGSRSPSNTDFEVEYGGALIDHIEEKLDDLESAPVQAPPSLAVGEAPEGWQLVPKEPTEAMLAAVAPFPEHLRVEHPNPEDPWHTNMRAATWADQLAAASNYREMLAAAPQEPK